MAARAIPESTKTSLGQRLRAHARQRWPALADVEVRFRGRFAYVDGELPGGEVLPLCRLRYAGSASLWGFAIHLASRNGYQDSVLPSGMGAGTPQRGAGLCLRAVPGRPDRLAATQPTSQFVTSHELPHGSTKSVRGLRRKGRVIARQAQASES
jgi:hypothetical protein